MKSAFYGNPVATTAAVASTTPAERAVLPAPAWPNQLVHRPVRFPSSRKFLWDRTPLGRVEVIELKDYLPVLSVPSDLHQRLPPCTSTLAVVACPSGRQLHVTVPGSSATPNPMVESITVALGASGQELVRGLVQTLQHSLDRRGSAQLTTGLALALSLKAAGAAAEGGVMGSSHVGCGSATLSATLLVPAAALTLTPLYSKRLCDVPLAQSLSQSKLPTSKVQTGYLTMDQARSLLPLAADDANVYSMPLVGVWVHGAKGLEHPTVYAAALKYAYTSCLPDLITQPDGAFLLLLFTGDSPVARCYEARFVDPPAALPGDRRLSPATPSSAASAANAGTIGVDSHGKNAGLRLLPYHVRAELAGQTSASLELNPVLDAVTAAALGPMLTLSPPNSSVSSQPPQRGALPGPAPSTAPTPYAQTHGHGCTSRPGAEAGVGTAYGNYDGISQLRGSGSKLMTSPSKAMKIFAQSVGASGTSSTGARYGAATVMDSAYGLAAGGQLQAAGRIEPGVMDTVVVGSDNQRDSPPMPRSAAVPTPFRMIPGHGGGTDGSNSEGRVGNTPPKDPRLQHRNGAGYTAAEKTTSLFDATTSVSRTDSSITDSLHARQRLAQSRNSQSGGCRTSGDWREHISGVMSTPSAALGPRPQRVVPDWEVAQPPTRPLSQQQQHYHGASVLQPWQVSIGAPDAQQPGLQQRFAADRTSLTSAANYSGNAPPRGALGSAAAAELGASPAETPRLQADQLRHQSLTEVSSWQTGGHARAMHFHSQLNHERPSTAVAPCREGRTAGRPSTAGAGADSTRLPPFANQSLDAWLKQASGYPTVAEHGDTLRNSSIVAASDQFKKPGTETVPLNHRTTDCTEPTGRVTLQSGSDVVNEDVAMAALLNSRQGQWTSAAQYRHGPGEDMGNRGHGGQATCKRTSDEIPLQPQDRQDHGQDQSAESKRAHHGYGQQQINMYSHYQRPQQQEQAAAEYDDDLPSDPVLLRQEVLFLRRQVASLQEQLRRMAATQNPGPEGRDHRLGLASSSQHPGAAVSPGCLTSASACPSAPQVHSVEVHNNGEWRLGRSAAGDSRNGQVGQKGLRSVHEETLRQQQQQHEYNNTHESQQSPGGSRSRPDSRGLAEEAGHGIIDSRRGATQSGIVMQHDDLFSGSAAATDPNDQLRRDGNAVQDGMACVRSGSITAVSLAATGTASDRVGLASMSTASDRGSVWSMASLRSSIMSYKSYRSAGTVHSSACTSDAGTAPTAALQDGAEPGPRSVGMPQQSMPVTEPIVLRGTANNGTCIESMASDATRLGPLQVVNVAGVDKAVGHGFPGIGCATVNAPALVSTCSVAFPPRVKHIRAGSINGLDIVSDSGGGRRRRRVRRASSDSESDLSVTSEPDDVAGGHSPPRGIAHRTHADRQATEGGRGTPPNAPGARSHEAMAVGPVVRTKYIPLDEESESSDAESELLLMQKYGIRA